MMTLQTLLKDHAELFEVAVDHATHASAQTKPYRFISTPEKPTKEGVIFLSQSQHLNCLPTHQNSLWIITKELWSKSHTELLEAAKKQNNFILVCKNLQIAMAHTLAYFDQRTELYAFPQGISPQTWIHPSATIESDVSIAPFTTIGPHVHIQKGSHIGPNCIIEGEVTLGADCFLEGHVFVGRQTQIGKGCRIKPFASIGADGYGYAPTQSGAVKIPQIGKVILEDFVDIGSGTCIDRATITYTRIGKGTKIDNLVHIAHNCEVGSYCFITAGFAMAGSSKIGDYFMTGGCCAVGDHIEIADRVTLAGASVVMSDIKNSGSYGGHPLQPMQSYLKTQVVLGQLPTMKKQMKLVLKHLKLDGDSTTDT